MAATALVPLLFAVKAGGLMLLLRRAIKRMERGDVGR
jgi:hypothetical protein